MQFRIFIMRKSSMNKISISIQVKKSKARVIGYLL